MEHESKDIIKAYGIDVPGYKIVNSSEEAVKASEAIGFPVVCKIASPDIIHKTDAGGIKLNLKNPTC